MDIKNLEALKDIGEKLGHVYFLGLYQILSSPKTFLVSKDLNSTKELVAASKFAVFISALNLIIAYPSLRMVGVEAESPYFLLVDTVITYAFFFLFGFIFYIVASLFRGAGTPQGNIVVFLYLTAFLPVFGLLQLPFDFATRGSLMKADGVVSLDVISGLGEIALDKPVVLISVLLSFGFLVYYAKSLFSGYRILHKTGRLRAFFIVCIGIVVWQAVSAYFALPVATMFHKSFQ